MIAIITARFKGKLLDLLGNDKSYALKHGGKPEFKIEGGSSERFIWIERARDDSNGQEFNIFIMARFFDGITWTVGIKSKKHNFFVKYESSEKPIIYCAEKEKGQIETTVNWICKDSTGRCYNSGLGE